MRREGGQHCENNKLPFTVFYRLSAPIVTHVPKSALPESWLEAQNHRSQTKPTELESGFK